jgi:hypothetical protein
MRIIQEKQPWMALSQVLKKPIKAVVDPEGIPDPPVRSVFQKTGSQPARSVGYRCSIGRLKGLQHGTQNLPKNPIGKPNLQVLAPCPVHPKAGGVR